MSKAFEELKASLIEECQKETDREKLYTRFMTCAINVLETCGFELLAAIEFIRRDLEWSQSHYENLEEAQRHHKKGKGASN